MGGWVVGVFSKGLAAVLGLAAVVWLGLWYFIPAPPSTLAMWSGLKGGAFEHVAQRYQERLARDHVTLDVRFSPTPSDNIKFLEDRNSGIGATFLFGGITTGKQSPEVMSLGRISFNPIWLFYRGSETLDRLTQLKGKRIGANFNFPPINPDS